MPGSRLALRILVTAFLFFFSLVSMQPMKTLGQSSAALLEPTAASLSPAQCFSTYRPSLDFDQETDCLPIISGLELVDGVIKTHWNGELKPSGFQTWEATSGVCQATVTFCPQNNMDRWEELWLTVRHALEVLHTKCVKKRKLGGTISFCGPANLNLCSTYYVGLQRTPTTHKTANTKNALITDPLLTHANDLGSPKLHQVESQENIPASAGLSAKSAALRHSCSIDSPGGYISPNLKKACHSICDVATGACDFAATVAYSTHHSTMGNIALGVGGIMQAGKGVANGLAINGKEDSAHSADSELSRVSIEKRGITVRSPEVEITYVTCFGDPLRSHPDINVIGCRDAITKLHFDSSGPKGSTFWRQVSESSSRTSQKTMFDAKYCTLEFELRTHEKAIWKSAPSMIKRLSDECLSKGNPGGLVVLKAKNAKQSLLELTIRPSLTWEFGVLETDSLVPKEDKVKHFCSFLPKQGCMSERMGRICQICCRWANVGCCGFGAVAIGTGHSIIGGAALPVGTVLSEGAHYFKYLSSQPETEEEHAEASHGDHIVKHRRSIDSGTPRPPIERSSLARVQRIQGHPCT